jgi:TIGR03009 family protein
VRGSIRKRYVIPAIAVLIATATSTASAQNTKKAAAAPRPQPNAAGNAAVPGPPPDPAKMKAVLKDWETISSKLKTLEVDITRVDDSTQWGKDVFVGEAKLMSPNLAYLNFSKCDLDLVNHEPIVNHNKCKPATDPKTGEPWINPKTGKQVLDHKDCKPQTKPHERIVCTGKEVWQYVVETTQIFIFPLDKEDQKRALEEGPLPFLFNMEAAKAEARYTMALVKEEGDYYVIGVVPKLKIDLSAFSQAFIRLNKKTYFPDSILLVATDGKSKKLFTLSNPKANREIDPRYFQGKVFPAPWVVERDPANGPAAPANPPRGIAGQPKRAGQGGAVARPR